MIIYYIHTTYNRIISHHLSPHLLLDAKRSRISYNSAITACEKSSLWQLALDLFGGLVASQLQPDAFSYGSVICACQEQWALALALLYESFQMSENATW